MNSIKDRCCPWTPLIQRDSLHLAGVRAFHGAINSVIYWDFLPYFDHDNLSTSHQSEDGGRVRSPVSVPTSVRISESCETHSFRPLFSTLFIFLPLRSGICGSLPACSTRAPHLYRPSNPSKALSAASSRSETVAGLCLRRPIRESSLAQVQGAGPTEFSAPPYTAGICPTTRHCRLLPNPRGSLITLRIIVDSLTIIIIIIDSIVCISNDLRHRADPPTLTGTPWSPKRLTARPSPRPFESASAKRLPRSKRSTRDTFLA